MRSPNSLTLDGDVVQALLRFLIARRRFHEMTPTDDQPVIELRLVGGHPQLVCRPLFASVMSASLEFDLQREWPIRPAHDDDGYAMWYDRSLVNALLGLRRDDGGDRGADESRLLDVAYTVGVDWASALLGRPVLDIDPTGEEVASLVADAVRKLDRDLERLEAAFDFETAEAVPFLDQILGRVQVGLSALAPVVPCYRSSDIVALAAMEVLLRWADGQQVVVCANCGSSFFPAERTDEVYCRRVAPGSPVGNTCQKVGPQRRYSAHLDELTAVYRKRGKVMDQRRRRQQIGGEVVERWREAARRKLDLAKRGKWAPERLDAELRKLEQRVMREGD